VRQRDAKERNAFRRNAAAAWKVAFARKTAKKPNLDKKAAGIDLGRAQIIDFLAADNKRRRTAVSQEQAIEHLRDPLPASSADAALWQPDRESLGDPTPTRRSPTGSPVVDEVEALAEHVVCRALDDIRAELGGQIPDKVKVALADHFWCDLLAQLAHAIDEGLKHIESVPDRLTDWVMKSREQSRWQHLEARVVRAAARSVWSKLRFVTFSGMLNRSLVLPVIRLLAVLMCKSPERHKAVVEHCVDPLGKGVLAKVKEKLVEVLGDWLPKMSRSGA
jgi:hypothetical protein